MEKRFPNAGKFISPILLKSGKKIRSDSSSMHAERGEMPLEANGPTGARARARTHTHTHTPRSDSPSMHAERREMLLEVSGPTPGEI